MIDNYLKKLLVISAIFITVIASIPVVVSENISSYLYETEEMEIYQTKGTQYFGKCIIFIFGNCNRVTGPLVWMFGLFFPLLKRNFGIIALGEEGEKLNVIIKGDEFATYYDIENINIQIRRANGFFFCGSRCLFVNNSSLFILCKANQVWVTT